jgi:phospholipase/carboxylesterase
VTLGPRKPEDKGGALVVLLHGWGARGDDLVPLARALSRPGARFLVPAAPLSESGGGRAWWHLDPNTRPAHAASDELPKGHRPSPQLTASREAVQALLRDAKQRYAPESIAIGGFSQGAMLSLDVALAADPPVDRVAVLSGVLLADSLPALHAHAPNPARPSVLVTHGSADTIVPFRGGQSIASVLEPRGYRVTWVPFEGGHEIPPLVVTRLREFLFGAAP